MNRRGESPGGGAVPEPQKIITSIRFIRGGPHPRRGWTRKNNAGATPRVFGLPLLEQVLGLL